MKDYNKITDQGVKFVKIFSQIDKMFIKENNLISEDTMKRLKFMINVMESVN